jgi:hypothetical protein
MTSILGIDLITKPVEPLMLGDYIFKHRECFQPSNVNGKPEKMAFYAFIHGGSYGNYDVGSNRLVVEGAAALRLRREAMQVYHRDKNSLALREFITILIISSFLRERLKRVKWSSEEIK